MEGGVVTSRVEGNSEGSSIRSTLKSLDMDLETIWAVSIAGHLELGHNNGEKKWYP